MFMYLGMDVQFVFAVKLLGARRARELWLLATLVTQMSEQVSSPVVHLVASIAWENANQSVTFRSIMIGTYNSCRISGSLECVMPLQTSFHLYYSSVPLSQSTSVIELSRDDLNPDLCGREGLAFKVRQIYLFQVKGTGSCDSVVWQTETLPYLTTKATSRTELRSSLLSIKLLSTCDNEQ